MSQYGQPFVSAAAGGSPMELAYKTTQSQTNRQAELINNLRTGASRKFPKSRKSFRADLNRRSVKGKSKKVKHKTKKVIKRGGGIPYSAPSHPTEPSNTKYPQGDLVKGLLTVGSQHAENSKYDSQINAAPAVYTDPNQVPKLGGKRKHKSNK